VAGLVGPEEGVSGRGEARSVFAAEFAGDVCSCGGDVFEEPGSGFSGIGEPYAEELEILLLVSMN